MDGNDFEALARTMLGNITDQIGIAAETAMLTQVASQRGLILSLIGSGALTRKQAAAAVRSGIMQPTRSEHTNIMSAILKRHAENLEALAADIEKGG